MKWSAYLGLSCIRYTWMIYQKIAIEDDTVLFAVGNDYDEATRTLVTETTSMWIKTCNTCQLVLITLI